jgi:hypothetical protein
VLLSAAALSGCISVPAPEPMDDALPIALDDPRAAALSLSLLDTSRDRHSLIGSARVSLSGPELRLSRPQRVAVREPASLRVEILGLFDQVVAILTTDGERYQVYRPGEDRIEEGAVSAELLWSVARVDLEPDEAVSLLLGAPWQTQARLADARELEDGSVLLDYRRDDDGGRRIFEFDPDARLARVRQRAPDDHLVWEAAYSDYRSLGERSFAHRIEVEFPRVEARADFRFQAAELNREVPDAAFVLGHVPGS